MTGEIKLNSLNILHISDAHIQLDAKEEVSEIVVKMINDALKVQKEQDIKIDLVCFTGDLIQRGDKALDDEKQLEIAEEILVNPLLNSLGLENNKFIIIPGNHEVDVKKIVKATEKGLLVDSLEEINDNVSDMNESYLARLDYFYQWIDNYYDDIIREKIGYAFLREINGKKIGIACIDSAWRSSGKGGCEKGIMYVGQKQINDLYKHIKDADIKICLMHHPTDWLSDYESTIIEREVSFPIALQHVILENVGTPKLEVAIDELMEQKKYKPFEKFMIEFLKCDLNVGNVIPELHRYIQKETSEGIIKLIIMKLLFYYRMRFFGTNKQIYNGILDLIIEAQIKLNMNKDLTKVLKGNKSLVRKELAKQIENNPNINL